jgi:RNA polymerase sigma-70 factor (ECF subfamily)
VLACLIGYFGDFDLAEEAAAEAFAIATQRWPSGGVPDNPGAWLVTTARNRAIDRLRRDRVLAAKLRLLAAEGIEKPGEDGMTEAAIGDERLELVFMCCHPALAIEAQVALTLRAVGGLSTEEIARAFLVPAETMKRRLTRAKSKIKVAGIPFSGPARACPSGSTRCWPSSTSSLTRATAARKASPPWRPRRSGSAGFWPRCSRPSRRCSGCWR